MSSQRLIFVIATLAALAVVVQSKNVVFGQRRNGDQLIETKTILKPAQSKKAAVAQYTCTPLNGKKVTAVELVDRNGNKNVADAKILRGAIGQAYVTIAFHSQIHYGIHYIVKCYV